MKQEQEEEEQGDTLLGIQCLPPYHIYTAAVATPKGGLDWSKHWEHCRVSDVDELFPESPVAPTSPTTLAKLKRVKRTDWDGAEQRKMDKLITTKK